jgi:hypothetical protein
MKFTVGQIVFVKDNILADSGRYGIVVEDLDTWYTIIMEDGYILEVGQDLIKPMSDEDMFAKAAFMQPYFKALHRVFTETVDMMNERNR